MIDKTKKNPHIFRETESSNISLLQRNYIKMLPILKELHRSLVREDGEKEPNDESLNVNSSDEDNDELLPSVKLENEKRGLNIQNNDMFTYQRVGPITLSDKIKRKNKIDCRNLLGFMNQNLYHDYLNITNIMKLKRLDFRDVYSIR
jgi:hypothetical protein